MELGSWSIIQAPSLLALIPLVVYIVLVFRGKNNVSGIIVGIFLAVLMLGQNLKAVSVGLAASLGSSTALIGMIIMAGAGLGVLMSEAGVSRTMVYWIVKRIGVNTQTKAKIALIICSIIICGLLGTLGGGFTALSNLLGGLAGDNASAVMLIASVVGGFGIEAAAVAEIKIISEMFAASAIATGLPMSMFAISILAATRLTGSMYPTTNLMGQLGIAHCDNTKEVLRANWFAVACVWAFLIVWAFLGVAILK